MRGLAFAMGLLGLVLSGPVQAVASTGNFGGSLIGDTIEIRKMWPYYGDVEVTTSVLVVAGVSEVACTGNYSGPNELCSTNSAWDIDIQANDIQLSWPNQSPDSSWQDCCGDFNGLEFVGLDWTGQPRRLVGFNAQSNFSGWDNSRVTFTDDSLVINFPFSAPLTNSSFVNIQLLTAPIPEPSTALLLGIGLAGLGMRRRAH